MFPLNPFRINRIYGLTLAAAVLALVGCSADESASSGDDCDSRACGDVGDDAYVAVDLRPCPPLTELTCIQTAASLCALDADDHRTDIVYVGPLEGEQSCTAIGCSDAGPCGGCCNSCGGSFVVTCDTSIDVTVEARDEYEFAAVPRDAELCGSNLPVFGSSRFGGSGTDCVMTWAPAPPDAFEQLQGTFFYEDGRPFVAVDRARFGGVQYPQ